MTFPQIIYYNTSKTFVIDHPNDNDKYLVHACLEGPETGVYYRGKVEITNEKYSVINLPDYLPNLAFDLTIQVTHIFENKFFQLSTTEIVNNKFEVHSKDGNAKFHWHVYGKRADIVIEPSKNDVMMKKVTVIVHGYNDKTVFTFNKFFIKSLNDFKLLRIT